MRIISGCHRGRRLIALPQATTTRPTTDRTREMIFNILLHSCVDSLEGLSCLDGFAGTGAFGFEALSRGISHSFFIENNPRAFAILKKNGHYLGEQARMTCYSCDLLALPRARAPCQLIFLDPPYDKQLVPPALMHLHKQGWVQENAWVIVEMRKGEALTLPVSYLLKTARTCGPASVYFFQVQEGG